ncbi:hypothetical protein M885DRAFT_569352 [Pelagophyceae sp. CCMP2097]|nr:hypothetical protein M885DRAFT_569352 [Pelagophyceae sp. CCMP2097]
MARAGGSESFGGRGVLEFAVEGASGARGGLRYYPSDATAQLSDDGRQYAASALATPGAAGRAPLYDSAERRLGSRDLRIGATFVSGGVAWRIVDADANARSSLQDSGEYVGPALYAGDEVRFYGDIADGRAADAGRRCGVLVGDRARYSLEAALVSVEVCGQEGDVWRFHAKFAGVVRGRAPQDAARGLVLAWFAADGTIQATFADNGHVLLARMRYALLDEAPLGRGFDRGGNAWPPRLPVSRPMRLRDLVSRSAIPDSQDLVFELPKSRALLHTLRIGKAADADKAFTDAAAAHLRATPLRASQRGRGSDIADESLAVAVDRECLAVATEIVALGGGSADCAASLVSVSRIAARHFSRGGDAFPAAAEGSVSKENFEAKVRCLVQAVANMDRAHEIAAAGGSAIRPRPGGALAVSAAEVVKVSAAAVADLAFAFRCRYGTDVRFDDFADALALVAAADSARAWAYAENPTTALLRALTRAARRAPLTLRFALRTADVGRRGVLAISAVRRAARLLYSLELDDRVMRLHVCETGDVEYEALCDAIYSFPSDAIDAFPSAPRAPRRADEQRMHEKAMWLSAFASAFGPQHRKRALRQRLAALTKAGYVQVAAADVTMLADALFCLSTPRDAGISRIRLPLDEVLIALTAFDQGASFAAVLNIGSSMEGIRSFYLMNI